MSQADNQIFLKEEANSLAMRAICESKAGYFCEDHSDVLLSNDDSDAEKHAYAIATNLVKQTWGGPENHELVMQSVQTLLAEAPIDCPSCEHLYGRD